ncbi:TetR/AcrR family transcriptional regulator [Amycolatopsis lurida]
MGTPQPSQMSTRDRLLQAVIEIAGREGQHMVTYRSVAARAKVAHGLVRHYFGTREAMLAEALRLAANQDINAANLAVDAVDDFARGTVEALGSDMTLQLLQYDLVLNAIRGGDKQVAIDLYYRRYISEVASTLRNLGIEDPGDEWATLILSVLDSLILQHALYDSPERTEAILARVRELLGLLASRSTQYPDSQRPQNP